jgi:tripartite-type tricarboxylate transporter receptor subunit TctC
MFPAITGSLPHVRAGKLRALGVTSEQRLPILPDVPPVGESLKGYVFVGWYGLVVPAGTPAPIVDKLYADTSAVLGNPEIRNFLAGEGLTAAIGNPTQFTNYIGAELKKSARLVASAGLQKN